MDFWSCVMCLPSTLGRERQSREDASRTNTNRPRSTRRTPSLCIEIRCGSINRGPIGGHVIVSPDWIGLDCIKTTAECIRH
ncbi:hypothetical protein K437DRAFT_42452 [Tilletiaria anomala UBC 951]|uniref:Uncharacterized protein n=1 Tax=Tilletiaria anomala (strain ATCC 24038 / CBS 436.72 / UBC 951) TaxID=1037660 RepID=A0A066VF74_TILAU|nr:uncharacterized protein K437DRAFT_42452 [Tilletiaria anomala UBC 951]KDN37245.1 hypothetical protein K437DRAFT_42452 [Tilletiaria anomala UBC 951]